jgi:membrane peptidoglycan carboxypeptidase
VGAGLLVATVLVPVFGVAGIAARNIARTFSNLPVQTLGQLPARSELLDTSGHVIAYYYPRNIYRVPVAYNQIAPVMRDAIVAIEDARFYHHGAVDFRGTIRAIISTLSGAQVQGASTLAQQYVKNACILTSTTAAQVQACTADTVARKLREIRAAANVMREMTRNQVLAAYLDAAYFGHQAWGIEVASRFYFSESAQQLTLTQASLLAGLVQNPYAYDPLVFRRDALDRRNRVLARMAALGYISHAEARRAQAAKLGLHISSVPLETGCFGQTAAGAAFFCDYVLSVMHRDPVYARAWAALNLTGGLKIMTTMSGHDQSAAERAVRFIEPANSVYYNPGQNVDTEVLIQPGTGYIRAIAVNRPYGIAPGETTVDYAVNLRNGASSGVQTGSSAKIFTLVTALKQGLPFGYHLRVKSPTVISPYYNCHGQPLPPYKVINAEGPQSAATYTIYTGTVASINAFYATLEQRIGLCNVVKTAVSLGMTRADGVSLLSRDRHLPPGKQASADNFPSFTLGSIYVSPMSMAAAYATLAARGVYCKPVAILAITDVAGHSYPVQPRSCHRAISQGVADAATYVLRGVLGPSGTGYNRGIGIPAAAKTGTANGGYYAAFAGFTPLLCGYVSVFNPLAPTTTGAMIYPRATYREVGGALAAPNQMFGDNAPGATWQLTFLRLHLRAVSFAVPPYYFFRLPLNYKPPKKHKPSPSPSPSPTSTATPAPLPTPTHSPRPKHSHSPHP